MKTIYRAAVMTVVGALLTGDAALRAITRDDPLIESSAKNSYVFKTYLKDDSVDVQSKEGSVILLGTVADESHKTLAQETVAGLPGVISVHNRLKVKEKQAANSDNWLETKVKSTLLFHANVNAVKTEVEVKNGQVTLRGQADSEAQKELTAEYARDVDGVKGVKNDMTVAQTSPSPAEKVKDIIDDASITAQVKLALLYHHSTSAIRTKTVTNDGVVTLNGKARNGAEKDLVSKLIRDIKGVKSVNNQMTVQQAKKG